MKRILNQSHNRNNYIYAAASLLERSAYYGLRAILIIYMTGEILEMSTQDALRIFGWMATAIMASKIVGALLGDLLLGNRFSVIMGGLLQAIGAFCFCIPTMTGIYIGLAFIILGSGLYSPNLIAQFGKSYLNKSKLLDSGFTIFYLAVNIGSFIGIAGIGYLGEKTGWNNVFIASGIIMLLAVALLMLIKNSTSKPITEYNIPTKKRASFITLAFILVGAFWAIYGIGNISLLDLQLKFMEIKTLNLPKEYWAVSNFYFMLPIGIIAIVLWSRYYSNQFNKLTIGFLYGALGFTILYFVPETPRDHHLYIYLVALFLLTISEIHIAPIIHSILTQYTNPKYLAIVISMAFIPSRLFVLIAGQFNKHLYSTPGPALTISIVSMLIIGIALIIYISTSKEFHKTTE